MRWGPTRQLERWLRQSGGKNPPAIILGGSYNALSFARSLGRRGIPLLMLESERFLGTYTRYGKLLLLPPVEESTQSWIECLEFVGARLERSGVLFPTSDAHSLFVAHHSDRLQCYFRFLVPDTETLNRIVDKRVQYGIAQAVGIPIPRSLFPESIQEVRLLANDVAYPCLLKPYRSHAARKRLGKKKLLVVRSPSELISRYAEMNSVETPLMVQEIVPGADSALFGYLALWDGEGHELAWVTKRKLRQFPAQYGDGSLQVTVEAPEVAELSRRLLQTFAYRGFVGVEFKLDARDHTHRLMEINPRAVSGNQLAISAGVDFPWIGYEHLTGIDLGTAPGTVFRSDVKYVNEEWDVQAYLALRKSGAMRLGGWLGSLRDAEAKAVGAWDDPMPFLVGLWRFLRHLGERAWSATRGLGGRTAQAGRA
jgi:D-aspartate ligase